MNFELYTNIAGGFLLSALIIFVIFLKVWFYYRKQKKDIKITSLTITFFKWTMNTKTLVYILGALIVVALIGMFIFASLMYQQLPQ